MTPDAASQALPARLSDITLRYSSEERWDESSIELEIWHVAADVDDPEGIADSLHVGDFAFIVADPYRTSDLWGLMDGYDADLAAIAEALLEPSGNDLRRDLQEDISGIGTGVLILFHAQLEERWQGHGVGAALAAKAIRRLGGGCKAAACKPAPMPRDRGALTDHEWKRGALTLARSWSRLGFKAYRDGVMILDLGLQSTVDLGEQRITEAEALPQPDFFWGEG
jgi:GNAT superfamily N-acetyltransferase